MPKASTVSIADLPSLEGFDADAALSGHVLEISVDCVKVLASGGFGDAPDTHAGFAGSGRRR